MAMTDFPAQIDDFLRDIRHHTDTVQRVDNSIDSAPETQSHKGSEHTGLEEEDTHSDRDPFPHTDGQTSLKTPPRRAARPESKCLKRKMTHTNTHDPYEINLASPPLSSPEVEDAQQDKENL